MFGPGDLVETLWRQLWIKCIVQKAGDNKYEVLWDEKNMKGSLWVLASKVRARLEPLLNATV